MTKLPHTPPEISVDGLGQVKWTAPALNYDPDIFYRGKTVTNTEFNELFLKQTVQSNYGTDSFKKFLTEIFPQAVYRQVKSKFNFDSSYIRPFVSEDWGDISEDGYCYIQIPVSEHGFDIDPEITSSPNIEVEMYAFDPVKNNFYKVDQVSINEDNTVVLYSDIVDLIGYVIIRINRKIYTIASQEKIDASQISGLANVALTGDYDDLLNAPNVLIKNNTDAIQKIINGSTPVAKAQAADTVRHITEDTTFNGIAFTDIFEEGSSYVKNATQAKNYDEQAGTIKEKFDKLVALQEETQTEIINTLTPKITEVQDSVTDILDGTVDVPKSENATYAAYASTDITKGTIEERLSSLGFKSGGIALNQDIVVDTELAPTQNKIIRQGNYCILNFFSNLALGEQRPSSFILGSAPYLPKTSVECFARWGGIYASSGGSGSASGICKVHISAETGVVTVRDFEYEWSTGTYVVRAVTIHNFGYEAVPIK